MKRSVCHEDAAEIGPAEDAATVTQEESWYLAEAHAADICSYVAEWNGVRDLHLADLFSASQKAADMWKLKGYKAVSTDIRLSEDFDVLSKNGFQANLDICLRVVVGGFALAGPPCSLFIWLSSSVHCRTSANPSGNAGHWKVRMATAIAANCCKLVRILASRGV